MEFFKQIAPFILLLSSLIWLITAIALNKLEMIKNESIVLFLKTKGNVVVKIAALFSLIGITFLIVFK